MEEYEQLKFASLLHDIGKFYQRTGLDPIDYDNLTSDDFGNIGAHAKWSADFINRYYDDDTVNLALYHHNKKNHKNHNLGNIVVKADRHSCGERKELDDNQKGIVNRTPLISIFSKISLNNDYINENYFMKLNALNLDESFENFIPVKKSGESLKLKYRSLWNDFIRDMNCIKNPYDLTTVLSLLRKYTSNIPSVAYKHESDISLYDHLKTTCAIAVSRYKYNLETNNLKQTDNQEVYLAINGDISGIQDFIYKVSSPQDAQRGMSKRLRGRSLYLSLLSDALSSYIIHDLDLTDANILFVGGGRFTIIANNNENVKKKLKELDDKINNYFIKKFNAELYLSLTYTPFSGDDLKEFNKVMECISYENDKNKKHKFINHLNTVFKLENEAKYQNSCIVCGNLIKNSNDKFCPTCKIHEKLGSDVANANYLIKIFTHNPPKDFIYFEDLNIAYKFEESNKNIIDNIKEYDEKYNNIIISRLNSTDFLSLNNNLDEKLNNVSFTFSFMGNTVPKINNNVLTFDMLANESKGANKLGILKMDVDNLGKIFTNGLKREDESLYSISRLSTLSSQLDLFFSGFINKINNSLKIYIIYSGGDDVLVIGPYDDIINFSIKFRNSFKQWTCNNEDITISAGISITNNKFPIGKSAILADEMLEKSKVLGKDKITIFNETVPWTNEDNKYIGNFEDLLNYANWLELHVDDYKDLSKSFVYSQLILWRNLYSQTNINNDIEWEKDYNQRLDFKRHVPMFKYRLRNITDKNLKKELNTKLKYMPWIKIPVSYVSLRLRD